MPVPSELKSTVTPMANYLLSVPHCSTLVVCVADTQASPVAVAAANTVKPPSDVTIDFLTQP